MEFFFGQMKNTLIWKCETCGWITPRHICTKQLDMPKCHQSLNQPKPITTEWNKYGRLEDQYQYHCNGNLVEAVYE